ncbi:hypothetical protein [Aurantiacibacter zhengii]|uniref:Secreted protein n=1 Tax=Aurantiacibacter zhengii TaxID=2307003 RepID=A0A418NXL4_9SPHN|nr:hypothetical protein [Aurantiacibacter zhengii]RIV89336.1 hypothetical protein D2V07_03645 [Aurantiacibacter zhengii]
MKSKPTLLIACLVLAGVAFIFEDTEDTSRLEAATQDVIASKSGADENFGGSGGVEPTPRAALAHSSEVHDNASAADASWYDVADADVEPDEAESVIAEEADAGNEPLIEDYDPEVQAPVGSTSATTFVPAPTVRRPSGF